MEQFIWAEKYRPANLSQCILPESIMKSFQSFIDQKNIPNLLLVGPAGIGKTSAALAMVNQLRAEYLFKNSSKDRNIDTLRNEIETFASSVSFNDGRKYVILDEADFLNPQSTQPALRNFMEFYAKNCGFILTCNYPHKILPELHSRLTSIEFKIPKEEKLPLIKKFVEKTTVILREENIKFDVKAVAGLMLKKFPDWRKVLNTLQYYANTHKEINSGILALNDNTVLSEVISSLKSKDFLAIRKWAAENNDVDSTVLFRYLYDHGDSFITAESIPQLVLLLGQYQYNHAFVADKEINISACLFEISNSCIFK